MNNTVKDFEIENGILVGYSGKDKVVEIPNTVTKIRNNVFPGRSSIEKVIIPDSVTKIMVQAFFANSVIKEVVLPETLEVIGREAFAMCIQLKTINIPASVKKIANNAFLDCPSLPNETVEQIQKINPDAYSLVEFNPNNPNNSL